MIITYSPYKYEVHRTKTHEMRARNFLNVKNVKITELKKIQVDTFDFNRFTFMENLTHKQNNFNWLYNAN